MHQGRSRREQGLVGLTGKLVSFEMGLPRELCSAGFALLGLRNGGDVTGMGLSGTVGFLGLWGATDYVFLRRHGERGRGRMCLLSNWVDIGKDVSNHFMRLTNLVRPSGKVACRPMGGRKSREEPLQVRLVNAGTREIVGRMLRGLGTMLEALGEISN